eukprot:757269-Hanusia_phi.AAC.6
MADNGHLGATFCPLEPVPLAIALSYTSFSPSICCPSSYLLLSAVSLPLPPTLLNQLVSFHTSIWTTPISHFS